MKTMNKYTPSVLYEKQRLRLMIEWQWSINIIRIWRIEESYMILDYKALKIDFGSDAKEVVCFAKMLEYVHNTIQFWMDYSSGIRDLYFENEKNSKNYNEGKF